MLNEDHLGNLAEESADRSEERNRNLAKAVRLVLGWGPPKKLGRARYWLLILNIIPSTILFLFFALEVPVLAGWVSTLLGYWVSNLLVYNVVPALLIYTIHLRGRDTDSPICGIIGVLTAVLLLVFPVLFWVSMLLPEVILLDFIDLFGGILWEIFLRAILAGLILAALGVIVVGVWPPVRGHERGAT